MYAEFSSSMNVRCVVFLKQFSLGELLYGSSSIKPKQSCTGVRIVYIRKWVMVVSMLKLVGSVNKRGT